MKPRVNIDGTGVDLANSKMSMNPFDEIAIEEAIGHNVVAKLLRELGYSLQANRNTKARRP